MVYFLFNISNFDKIALLYRFEGVMKKFFSIVFLLLVCMLFLSNQEASAYINPGSGSYIFQTVIGGILSIIYFVKKIFVSLFGLFKSKKESEKNESDE